MSIEIAKRCPDITDDPDCDVDDIMKFFREDARLMEPRVGVVEGKEAIREFFESNVEFHVESNHKMTNFYQDGNTVISEGTLDGKTAEGREFEDIGLLDVFVFDDNDMIKELRIYLDYSGIYNELPEDVPPYDI